MFRIVSDVLDKGGVDLRRRLIVIYAVLIVGQVLIWLWASVWAIDLFFLERRYSPIPSACATQSTPIISRRSTT